MFALEFLVKGGEQAPAAAAGANADDDAGAETEAPEEATELPPTGELDAEA